MGDVVPGFWTEEGFEVRFGAWCDVSCPSAEQARIVLSWLLSLAENPYIGRREDNLSGLYRTMKIPGSRLVTPGGTTVVVACWFVFEEIRTIRLDQLATLTLPL